MQSDKETGDKKDTVVEKETGDERETKDKQDTKDERETNAESWDPNDLIESISWISISTSPLQWMHPTLSLQPDLLLPENPIIYLWWEACFSLSLPMLPLMPFNSKFPDDVTKAANETFLRDSAQLCQAVCILSSKSSSWEEAFVATNKQIVDRMKELLAAKESSTILSLYKRTVRDWTPLWESFDTTLVLAPLDTNDALFTAQVIASEYIVNGIHSALIPESVLARLERGVEMYDTLGKSVIETGLIIPHVKLSTKLIPYSLYCYRMRIPLDTMNMETFALSGAFPMYAPDQESKTVSHAQSIAQLLMREASEALPTDLFAWKGRADKLLKIASLVLKPFYVSPKFAFLPSDGNESKSLHVSLLPSLQTVLSELVQDEDQVTIFSRLEWNPTMRKMAYCIYIVQKSPVFDEFVARMRQEPWHDRWHEYRAYPWTKLSLEWISAQVKPDRGLRLSCPTMLMSVHPMARLGWWIEEKMRALLNVEAIDISTDFDPMLSGCCVSVIVPSTVTWPKEWTLDLKMLEQ